MAASSSTAAPGGKSKYTSGCFNPVTVEGPDGGNGSGGQMEVTAATIANVA